MPSCSKKITIIILNYNGYLYTIECLNSLLKSSVAPFSVIVVDNKSFDDSTAHLRHWLKQRCSIEETKKNDDYRTRACEWAEMYQLPATRVFLAQAKRNGGYAAGNNIGLHLAFTQGADAAWILNNDTLVDKAALEAMSHKLFSSSRYGICGSCIVYQDKKDSLQCRAGGFTNTWTGLSILNGHGLTMAEALQNDEENIEQSLNFIYGASVMITRAFFETIGPMDERYFLYSEEQDWAFAAQGQFVLAYAAKAIVHHKEGATIGFSGWRSTIRKLWWLTRSRLLLTYKYTPWALPTVCMGIGYAALRMLVRQTRIYK